MENDNGEISLTVLSEEDNLQNMDRTEEETLNCIENKDLRPTVRNSHNSEICLLEISDLSQDVADNVQSLKIENEELKIKMEELQKENSRLAADKSIELYQLQLETLEKVILEQKLELQRLDSLKNERIESLNNEIKIIKSNYDSKIEKINEQYEIVNKEKESMVMKYAFSEKCVLDFKSQAQNYEGKMKEILKDKDLLQIKIKTVLSEKQRLQQLLDAKNQEGSNLYKEIDIMKQQLDAKDVKIKWLQNNLQTELEKHKDMQTKLDKTVQKLNEAREETEQIRKDGQAMMRSYHENKEQVEQHQEHDDSEEKVKIIVENYEFEQLKLIEVEHETLKKKLQTVLDENNNLFTKVQSLEKQKVEKEQVVSQLKNSISLQQEMLKDLQIQLTDFESTKCLLQHEQERLVASQTEVEKLKVNLNEMQHDLAGCRAREAELLDYTQKLTDKNVSLQSEYTSVVARNQLLDTQVEPLKKLVEELEVNVDRLRRDLDEERNMRREENQVLARHLAERTQRSEELTQELADQVGENQLLKKKHAVTVKELTRELQIVRKKLDSGDNSSSANSICPGSRASSSTSLNDAECESRPATVTPIEPDRTVLIEKIVKLQKSNARKSEKLEFKEDHVKQLMSELKKKEKIIRYYALREQVGALAPEKMDDNKLQLSKHGGIMASVYTSRAVDESMTLDLSLDINSRLQAVLEDTLLKNIMLKDNMETLGNEIARLNKELQRSKT